MQDSTLSENIGSLIVTTMSNVTFKNCTIENNTAISKAIRFMEFISTNIDIEHCSFFKNNNSFFNPEWNNVDIREFEALIFVRSVSREPTHFVRLDYSRFNNSGAIILENILDNCIQNCNFSNTYFQMESTPTADVLKKNIILRLSASNFCCPVDCVNIPFFSFVKDASPGLNLFSSANFKNVLFKIITYQLKGVDFSKWDQNVAIWDKVILHHEEHAYASGKFTSNILIFTSFVV